LDNIKSIALRKEAEKLKGKRVLITAGGQGIGRSISESFLKAGCHVCVHYHTSAVDIESMMENAVNSEEQKLVSKQADLCKKEEAEALVSFAVEHLGGLDILINNAGSLISRKWLGELEPEFYTNSFDLNVGSMVWVTQASRPHLKASGQSSIVNLSSLAGRKGGHAGSLLYSTTKGAVLTLTRALSGELAGDGIRVNAVAPGLILGTSFHNTHTTEESAKATVSGIPLGRAGAPEDVARAVLYLASEYDGFITGATLDINGGVYCA
jgi:3-oxoacyl-[acyl-carrier protein] reductase